MYGNGYIIQFIELSLDEGIYYEMYQCSSVLQQLLTISPQACEQINCVYLMV